MTHQLTIEELNTFESKTQIAGAFSNEEHKSLNIIAKVLKNGELYSYYTVEVSGVEQLQTTNLEQIIVEYNSH